MRWCVVLENFIVEITLLVVSDRKKILQNSSPALDLTVGDLIPRLLVDSSSINEGKVAWPH